MCSVCGAPLNRRNITGVCSRTAECRSEQKRRAAAKRKRKPLRFCKACLEPLRDSRQRKERKNRTGYCNRTESCRKAAKRMVTKKSDTAPAKNRSGGPSWLLPPAYEIILENEDLPEDHPDRVAAYGEEIVDEVTVDAMVKGTRRVASTLKERQVAAQRMIEELHLDPQEVATRIGTLVVKLDEIIAPLGWTVRPRTNAGGKRVRPTARFERIDGPATASRADGTAAGKVGVMTRSGGRA